MRKNRLVSEAYKYPIERGSEVSGLTGVKHMSQHNALLNQQQREARKLINKALRKQTRGTIVNATGELVDQMNVFERALMSAVRRIAFLHEQYRGHHNQDETEILDELIEEALTQ